MLFHFIFIILFRILDASSSCNLWQNDPTFTYCPAFFQGFLYVSTDCRAWGWGLTVDLAIQNCRDSKVEYGATGDCVFEDQGQSLCTYPEIGTHQTMHIEECLPVVPGSGLQWYYKATCDDSVLHYEEFSDASCSTNYHDPPYSAHVCANEETCVHIERPEPPHYDLVVSCLTGDDGRRYVSGTPCEYTTEEPAVCGSDEYENLGIMFRREAALSVSNFPNYASCTSYCNSTPTTECWGVAVSQVDGTCWIFTSDPSGSVESENELYTAYRRCAYNPPDEYQAVGGGNCVNTGGEEPPWVTTSESSTDACELRCQTYEFCQAVRMWASGSDVYCKLYFDRNLIKDWIVDSLSNSIYYVDSADGVESEVISGEASLTNTCDQSSADGCCYIRTPAEEHVCPNMRTTTTSTSTSTTLPAQTEEPTNVPDTPEPEPTEMNNSDLVTCEYGSYCTDYNNAVTAYLFDVASLDSCIAQLTVSPDRQSDESCLFYNTANQVCRLGKEIATLGLPDLPFIACTIPEMVQGYIFFAHLVSFIIIEMNYGCPQIFIRGLRTHCIG